MRARPIRLLGIGAMALVAALVPLASASADHGTGTGTVQATVRVFPMIVSLDTQPTTVTVGERFTLTAEVRNISSQNLQQVVAAVTFDPSLVQLRGPADKHLGSVNNRRTKTAEWRFEALAVGSVVLTVRVTAFDQEGGGAIEEEKTAIIEIIGGTARRDSEDDDEGEEDEEDDERGERDVGGTGDDESGAPRSDSRDRTQMMRATRIMPVGKTSPAVNHLSRLDSPISQLPRRCSLAIAARPPSRLRGTGRWKPIALHIGGRQIRGVALR